MTKRSSRGEYRAKLTYGSVRMTVLLSGIKIKPGTCLEILQEGISGLHSPNIIGKSVQMCTYSCVFCMPPEKGRRYLCFTNCL